MSSPSSLATMSPRNARVHIPSTSTTWDVESNSDSETEEEVEEMLVQALQGPSVKQQLSLRPSAVSRRDSLLLSGELGDDLPGAKARKVMGISMESGFDDWDQDDQESTPSPTASLGRSRSLKEAFRLRKPRGRRQGHQRGASLDTPFESDSDTGDDLPPVARKRRPSLSSVFGVSPRSSSSVPASPRLQATPSPILQAANMLKRKPTLPSSKTTGDATSLAKHAPFQQVGKRENEWSRELEEAAKAAEWQTSIEHRPKPSVRLHSQVTVGLTSPVQSESATRKRFIDGPAPSPSPALAFHLSQMADTSRPRERSSSVNGGEFYAQISSHAHQQQRRPSLPITPVSPAPSRPPRSALRDSRRRAVISPPPPHPHPLARVEATMSSIEYLQGETTKPARAQTHRGSLSRTISPAISAQSGASSRYSCSPSMSQESTKWRGSQDGFSARSDDYGNGFQSPALSMSSSLTSHSHMDVPLMVKRWTQAHGQGRRCNDQSLSFEDDVERPISPFMKPRKAPSPPGLALTLGEPNALHLDELDGSKGEARMDGSDVSVLHLDKPLPLRPSLGRCDSTILDPDLNDEGERQSEGASTLVTPTLLHHKDRPTSVPFSPPSAHAHELNFDDEDMEGDDRQSGEEAEDEFLAALDKLSSHLDLSSGALSFQLDRYVPTGGIAINLTHPHDDMENHIEFPFDQPSPVVSPHTEAQEEPWLPVTAASKRRSEALHVIDYKSSSDNRRSVQGGEGRHDLHAQSLYDDHDAVHFLQAYSGK